MTKSVTCYNKLVNMSFNVLQRAKEYKVLVFSNLNLVVPPLWLVPARTTVYHRIRLPL